MLLAACADCRRALLVVEELLAEPAACLWARAADLRAAAGGALAVLGVGGLFAGVVVVAAEECACCWVPCAEGAAVMNMDQGQD